MQVGSKDADLSGYVKIDWGSFIKPLFDFGKSSVCYLDSWHLNGLFADLFPFYLGLGGCYGDGLGGR